MRPRTELVLLAALSGGGLTLLGYLLAARLVLAQPVADSLPTALGWSPSGAMAALVAALLLVAWQRRATAAGAIWRPGGMAGRAVTLALGLYPLAVAAWVLASVQLDVWFAAAAMPTGQVLRWLPSIVLGATLAALVAAPLPAFAIAFLLCRRYLRRPTRFTTGTA